MKSKSPQEKKRLSYERDRRNRYGQNAKASRRLIPLRKAKAKRAYRKRTNQILSSALSTSDLLADKAPENRIAAVQKKRWQKAPDVSLAVAIKAKKDARIRRFGRRTGKAIPAGNLPGWGFNPELNHVDQEGILRKR
jgi:hypothetical protein